MKQLPGRPYPPGATWDHSGVNFALIPGHATCVELCLFDPSLRRRTFFLGREMRSEAAGEITWLRPYGSELKENDRQDFTCQCIGMSRADAVGGEMDEDGGVIVDDDLLLLLNTAAEDIEFKLPAGRRQKLLDTREPYPCGGPCSGTFPLIDRCLVILRRAR